MILFLDSSALAKRYVAERGSELVAKRCADAHIITLSTLAPIEVLSGLGRLRREGSLATSRYRYLKKELSADIAQARIVTLEAAVVKKAIHALEVAPLRTLDAIQIASAMLAECDLFLTADTQQARGAQVLKLHTELV
jgi:uncharacterized protein